MRIPSFSEETLIKVWIPRLLYFDIFIVLMFASGHLDDPKTIAFIGSILCLAITGIRLAQYQDETDEAAGISNT